jgi:hypothetical protein
MTTILRPESKMPALTGANEWLDADPVAAADLRGRVVLVDLRFRRWRAWRDSNPRPAA